LSIFFQRIGIGLPGRLASLSNPSRTVLHDFRKFRKLSLLFFTGFLLACVPGRAQTVEPKPQAVETTPPVVSPGAERTGLAAESDRPTDCAVHAYGAKGDGITKDTEALNAAIRDCHSRGGGTVVLSAGTYRSGTVRLLDNITLKLEPGSVLLGSDDLADYSHLARSSEERDTALIVAENAHNIAIVGEGTIDGNGRSFTDKYPLEYHPFFDATQTRQGPSLISRLAESHEGPVHSLPGPGVLLLVLHGDGILLRDFHVIDSPNWGVKLMCSNHISVSGLDVRNSMTIANNDALDISASSNVSISNTYLEAGDDALVIGGPCADGWCQQPEENVVVSNVILRSRSAAIRIGPAAKDVRNLTFQNVIIRDSNRGISIQARAGEVVENLLFTNVVSETRLIDGPWWGSGEPVSITVARWAYPSWAQSPIPGTVRHVVFSNLIVKSQSPIVLYSTEPGRIEDVQFQGLTLTLGSSPLQAVLGGNLDLQPATPISLGLVKHDLSAIEVHNVDGLSFSGLHVHWDGSFPKFYRNAFHADGFDALTIDGFTGQGSSPAYPALAFQHGKSLSIRNARADKGKSSADLRVSQAGPR
jgi:hypothetical protein